MGSRMKRQIFKLSAFFSPDKRAHRRMFKTANFMHQSDKAVGLLQSLADSNYVQLTRMARPTGTWLLYWPGAFGISMASNYLFLSDHALNLGCRELLLFGVGAILMRGAGCIVNDIWDRNIDGKVERTRKRPLARGACSPQLAMIYATSNSLLALLILLQFNDLTKILGVLSLPLVAMYPLMKRLTHWPQCFLGLTFNWPATMGWTAMTGSINLAVIAPLYAACILWTLHYDTIYAHQDKNDDRKLGLKSTALILDKHTKPVLHGFNVLSGSLFCLAGINNSQGLCFFVGQAVATLHRMKQIHCVNLDDRSSCYEAFCNNRNTGAIIFTAIMLDNLWRVL